MDDILKNIFEMMIWNCDNLIQSKSKQNKKFNSNQPNIESREWTKKHLIKRKDPKKAIFKPKKYYEVSITCLYLSNWINLIKKKLSFLKKLNLTYRNQMLKDEISEKIKNPIEIK